MKNTIEASQAEWEVLKVIWTLQEANSKNISEVLKETKNWESATTKTLLGRLVKKGYLQTEKQGNRYIYQATINEQEGTNNKTSDLMNSLCATTRGKALAQIIQDYDLSEQDRELILDAIKAKSFKKQLQCQCLGNCSCEAGSCTCNKG